MSRALLVLALAAMLGSATACGGDGATDGRRTVSLEDKPWTVLTASADGMRGRDGFDDADGMLFDLGRDVEPAAVVFVMDGVGIALDIAWFSAAGDLVGVASMTPCPAEPCPRYAAPGPFRWAIEAPPGAFGGLPSGARLVVGD